MQRALAEFYRDLSRHMPANRIVVVDGSGPVGDVQDRVWKAYQQAFPS